MYCLFRTVRDYTTATIRPIVRQLFKLACNERIVVEPLGPEGYFLSYLALYKFCLLSKPIGNWGECRTNWHFSGCPRSWGVKQDNGWYMTDNANPCLAIHCDCRRCDNFVQCCTSKKALWDNVVVNLAVVRKKRCPEQHCCKFCKPQN